MPSRRPARLQVLGDLDAQLTGRDDDERQRPAAFGVGGAAGGDPLEHRDAEREGLAGAGAGLADDIGAVSAIGRVSAWIGNGAVMPASERAVHDRGADAEGGEVSGRIRPRTRSRRADSVRWTASVGTAAVSMLLLRAVGDRSDRTSSCGYERLPAMEPLTIRPGPRSAHVGDRARSMSRKGAQKGRRAKLDGCRARITYRTARSSS